VTSNQSYHNLKAEGDFVASPSRCRIALLFLSALGFVAAGAWMMGAFGPVPDSPRYPAAESFWFGIASILLGSIASLWMVPEFLKANEVLRVGSAGVRYRRWSNQLIPWSQIREITTWTVRNQRGIALHLEDPSAFPGRLIPGALAKANRWFSGGDIHISLVGTDRSVDDALSALEQFRPTSE
jgi:hypothetical protein